MSANNGSSSEDTDSLPRSLVDRGWMPPRRPYKEFLHCTQHDCLTSGSSTSTGVVSTPATGLLPPQLRWPISRRHRAARRYCVLHLLLPALQPQPASSTVLGTKSSRNRSFFAVDLLVSLCVRRPTASEKETSASNSETAVGT